MQTTQNLTKPLEQLKEMLCRAIKPRQAESGTQTYGEVKVVGSVEGDVVIYTNIRERDPEGDHTYAGSPIMYISVNGEQIMDPVKITHTIMNLITEQIVRLKTEHGIDQPFHYYKD